MRTSVASAATSPVLLIFVASVILEKPAHVVFASPSSASSIETEAGGCWPRCCARGQILDPTGTRCLINRSLDPIPDDCPRTSFLPLCRGKNDSVSPAARPLDKKAIKAAKVLKGLSQYSLVDGKDGADGPVVNFYSVEFERERNASALRNNGAGGDNGLNYDLHTIPASFCVDLDNEKTLVCPPLDLDSYVFIYKCCPFGKQLKEPLFSGEYEILYFDYWYFIL